MPTRAIYSVTGCFGINLTNEPFNQATQRAFVQDDEQPRPRKPPERTITQAMPRF